jgi:hypothetical protein
MTIVHVNKLAANRRRDEHTDAALRANGWTALGVGEHEDPLVAAAQVRDVVFGIRIRSLGIAREPAR